VAGKVADQDRAAEEVGAQDEVTDGGITGHQLFEAIGRYCEYLARTDHDSRHHLRGLPRRAAGRLPQPGPGRRPPGSGV